MIDIALLTEITLVLMLSNLGSIGGGNGAIAIIQERWIPNGMVDPNLFAWSVALGNITPGPRIAFVSAIGYYLAGLPGAAAALIGIVIPNTVSAAVMTYGMMRLEPWVKRISLPAAFIISGMIFAAGWGLARPLSFKIYEIAAVLFVIWLVAWRRVDPVWIIVGAAFFGITIKLTGVA